MLPGPLGRDVQRVSTFFSADCGSVTFDSRGRIVTVCVGLGGPTLSMLDAKTLEPANVSDTLGVLLKYQDDIARLDGDRTRELIEEVRARMRAAE